jgi:hypothetical protein
VVIALVPQHAQRIKPPRTLLVPFDLGRPLGVPEDAGFQHRVLSAALELLERVDGPVFQEYEEQAPDRDDESEEGWSCPVTFTKKGTDEGIEQQLLNEIGLLQPWYDKGKNERGYTSFGVSKMNLEEIVSFLASFLNDKPTSSVPTNSVPLSNYSISDALKYAIEDLKAFHNESATSQPGRVTLSEVENWYWGETAAGRMVREIKNTCTDHADSMVKIVATFTLVPQTQAFRDN